MITCILLGIMYVYNNAFCHSCTCICRSIVYICKYCVCPDGPYDLLDFEIKTIYLDKDEITVAIK